MCVVWVPPETLAFPRTPPSPFFLCSHHFGLITRCHSLSCHRMFSRAIPSVWILFLHSYSLPSWLLSSHHTGLSFMYLWHPFWLPLLFSLLTLIVVIIFHLLVMTGECLAFLQGSNPTRSWIVSVFIHHYASSPNQRQTIGAQEICGRWKVADVAL